MRLSALKKLFLYRRLFRLFSFICSSFASLKPSSSSSADTLINGTAVSMLRQENFLNSLSSTYLLDNSTTSWSLYFIFWVTKSLGYFSRIWFLLTFASNITDSRTCSQILADCTRLTVNLVLIIEVPEIKILFLSWGPSLKFRNLLQLKYLQAVSIF